MRNSVNTLLKHFNQRLLAAKYAYLDNFIFIHINKTAGSSIEKALNIPLEHKTAQEKIQEVGRQRWDKKLTFAVVRNPWDKVVSHYHYRVKTDQTGLGDQHIDFKEWVERSYGNQELTYYNNPKMFMPQLSWITDSDGNILVDEILRFENLNEDFIRLTQMLGRELSLPHVKKSKRGSYHDYYDEQTIAIVEKWFSSDINAFDYQF